MRLGDVKVGMLVKFAQGAFYALETSWRNHFPGIQPDDVLKVEQVDTVGLIVSCPRLGPDIRGAGYATRFEPADVKVYLKPTPESLETLRNNYTRYWSGIREDDVFEQTDISPGYTEGVCVGLRCLRTGSNMGGPAGWYRNNFVEVPAPPDAAKSTTTPDSVSKPVQPKFDVYAAYQAVTLICNLDKLLDRQIEEAKQEMDRPMRPRYFRMLGTGDLKG